MRTPLFTIALASACLIGGAAAASTTTISDPIGDIIPSFGGSLPAPADLDVTSFTVGFDGTNFNLSATMAGAITTTSGFYVIGVNRGGAGPSPFAGIGEPNVIFNSLIFLQQNATGSVTLLPGGSTNLAAGTVTINGSTISVVIPLIMLPSTGFDPDHYGFSIWPRSSSAPAGNGQITDFAPNNATLAAVPEPATWAMLIVGFGMLGAAMRRRRSTQLA